MKDISIYGCCISRDIFGINGNGYNIKKYIFDVSPFTILEEPILGADKLRAEDFYNQGVLNFEVRSFLSDLKKTALNELKENNSDYIVVDFGVVRFPIYTVNAPNKNNKKSKITWSGNDYSKFKKLLDEKGFFKNYTWKGRSSKRYNEKDIQIMMEKLSIEILKIYPPEKIILHEILPAEYYYNNENYITKFNIDKSISWRIDKCNFYFKKYIPSCYVIKQPKYSIADERNKWGKMYFHMKEQYYEYCLKALNIISDDNLLNKNDNLLKLYNNYNDIFKLDFDNVIIKSLNKVNDQLLFTRQELNHYLYFKSKLNEVKNSNSYLESLQIYYKLNNNNKLVNQQIQSNKFVDLIEKLSKINDIVILLSIKNLIIEDFNKYLVLKKLNLKKFFLTENNIFSYTAVIDNKNNYIDEKIEKNNEGLNFDYVIDEHFFCKIFSLGFYEKTKISISNIYINNIDYSMNLDGINLCVFSRKYNSVIDTLNINLNKDDSIVRKI